MNFLITGGAGFIGSHLCEALIKNNHTVICIDNFDTFYLPEIKKKNISALRGIKKFILYNIDIRDKQKVIKIFTKYSIDVVLHLAAKVGIQNSFKHPEEYISVNINGTVSLLEAMKQTGVRKLIFASSSSVYGTNNKIPFKESDNINSCISIYASSKRSCEQFTRMYHDLHNISVIILRFFTVYGPRQRSDMAIHKFVKAILNSDKLIIYGDGTMARDYTYVSDIVQGIKGSIDRILTNPKIFEIYNLGNADTVTLIELVKIIESFTDKKTQVEFQSIPLGDNPITFADISRAIDYLKYIPQVEIEEGITRYIDWYKTL